MGKGVTMAKCRQCNVTILDDVPVCPLCQCVVGADPHACGPQAGGGPDSVMGNGIFATDHRTNAQTRINEYPDVWVRERRLKHISNIAFFVVLAASAALAAVNFMMPAGSWWSLIPIAAMAYAYAVFRLVFVSRKGYRWKTFTPLILAMVLLIIIDVETGFYGWSLNYVFPSGILLTDLIIIMLMLTNLKNWQSYMIMQICMIAASLVPVALWISGIITAPVLTLIAVVVSVLLFLGAVIIGGRTAQGELKRRFHIR